MMKWANALSLQKNSLKLNAASHNNTIRYTDTDGFLKHSPSGGSLYYKGLTLQEIIPILGGPSSWAPPKYQTGEESGDLSPSDMRSCF